MFDELGRIAPGYRAELRPEFGAATAGHRAAIRESLAVALGDADPSLKDLTTPPKPVSWSVSISHAGPLGGWLAVSSPRVVGFDLESRDRVREAVVRRICPPEELRMTDDFAALWCAKEALFKAAARGRTATLAQLRITAWDERKALTYFAGENGARGVVESNQALAAAWAVVGDDSSNVS